MFHPCCRLGWSPKKEAVTLQNKKDCASELKQDPQLLDAISVIYADRSVFLALCISKR